MIWNWQKPDWPNIQWDRAQLEAAEKQFLVNAGVFVGTVRHLGIEDREQLKIEAMSTEALTTSEIECDSGSRKLAVFPLQATRFRHRPTAPAERSIAEMMV